MLKMMVNFKFLPVHRYIIPLNTTASLLLLEVHSLLLYIQPYIVGDREICEAPASDRK